MISISKCSASLARARRSCGCCASTGSEVNKSSACHSLGPVLLICCHGNTESYHWVGVMSVPWPDDSFMLPFFMNLHTVLQAPVSTRYSMFLQTIQRFPEAAVVIHMQH